MRLSEIAIPLGSARVGWPFHIRALIGVTTPNVTTGLVKQYRAQSDISRARFATLLFAVSYGAVVVAIVLPVRVSDTTTVSPLRQRMIEDMAARKSQTRLASSSPAGTRPRR
jgi:hypothetical protein